MDPSSSCHVFVQEITTVSHLVGCLCSFAICCSSLSVPITDIQEHARNGQIVGREKEANWNPKCCIDARQNSGVGRYNGGVLVEKSNTQDPLMASQVLFSFAPFCVFTLGNQGGNQGHSRRSHKLNNLYHWIHQTYIRKLSMSLLLTM